MTRKRTAAVFVFWALLFVAFSSALVYLGFHLGRGRPRDITRRERSKFHELERGMGKRVWLVMDAPPFYITQVTYQYDSKETLRIEAANSYAVEFLVHDGGSDSPPPTLAVYRDSEDRGEWPLLSCGGLSEDGRFPGAVQYFPQTGYDSGRFVLSDTTLDGQWDEKGPLPIILDEFIDFNWWGFWLRESDPIAESPGDFTSEFPFRVFVARLDGVFQAPGIPLAGQPVAVPECHWWAVRPIMPITAEALGRKLETKGIPGLVLRYEAANAFLSEPKHLGRLRVLSLSSAAVTDSTLARLNELEELQALHLIYTNVGDNGLMHLSGMDSLTQLGLWHNKITDAGLEYLQGLANLDTLAIKTDEDIQLTKAGLRHLTGLTNLRTLCLEEENISDVELACLGEIKTLRALNIRRNNITDAGLAHLEKLDGLRILDLGWTDIADDGLEHLRGMSEMQKLWLAGTHITDAGLEHLNAMSEMRSLNLGGTQVTDAGLEDLRGMTEMRSLFLVGTQVTDTGLANLKALTNLRELALSRNKITDAGLAHLDGLANLRQLNLLDTQITDAGLEHLRGMTELRSLDLRGTQVTDAGLEHLKGMVEMQELYLKGTQVTDEGVDELEKALPQAKIRQR